MLAGLTGQTPNGHRHNQTLLELLKKFLSQIQ
jgi:hypothetical protein